MHKRQEFRDVALVDDALVEDALVVVKSRVLFVSRDLFKMVSKT